MRLVLALIGILGSFGSIAGLAGAQTIYLQIFFAIGLGSCLIILALAELICWAIKIEKHLKAANEKHPS